VKPRPPHPVMGSGPDNRTSTDTVAPDDGCEIGHERLHLLVVEGPDAGMVVDLGPGRHMLGTDASCAVRLTDSAISRQHAEIVIAPPLIELCDLGSKNGTFYCGARVTTLRAHTNTRIALGRTVLVLVDPSTTAEPGVDLGALGLVGTSKSMRRLVARSRQAARASVNVLITGETGVGKDVLAEAIHHMSPRSRQPFVVVDLGAVSGTLLESELFGHARGSFTGAVEARQGAFQQAHGGTIFLDEIGEVALELQARLLRAVERGEIKPVGRSRYERFDARVIAATNRDLSVAVRAGQFRSDLFHRLAGVVLHVPPLRDRPDDVPALVEHFLGKLCAPDPPPLVSASAMRALAEQPWPGNVRQLRNAVEQAYVFSKRGSDLSKGLLLRCSGVGQAMDSRSGAIDASAAQGRRLDIAVDFQVPFKEAKTDVVTAWERTYLQTLLSQCQGNVSLAARKSGVARAYLHELLKKHRIDS
jgi:two-component system, NtrC family, nitrogen regulation response regulator GlnG